jgi:hypothetical protein
MALRVWQKKTRTAAKTLVLNANQDSGFPAENPQ